MGKVKLSDFLQESIIKSYKDEHGEIKYKLVQPDINIEGIRFHNISMNKLDEISDKLKDIKGNIKSDSESIYSIFEYLTDIEKDVDINQFKSMFILPPNKEFEFIRDQLYYSIINILDKFKSIVELSTKSNKKIDETLENLPVEIQTIIKDQGKVTELNNMKNELDKLKIQLEDVSLKISNEKDIRKQHDLSLSKVALEDKFIKLEDKINEIIGKKEVK